MRRGLAGLSYGEQMAAVKPSLPLQAGTGVVQRQEAGGADSQPKGAAGGEAPKAAEKGDPAQHYVDLLGEKLGKQAYDLLMKHLNQDWLVKEATDALKKGSLSLEGIKDDIGLDDTSNAALVNFGDQLITLAMQSATKWLASESGKKFVGKLQGWARENPGYIVALAILGAAGYVTNTLYQGKLAATVGITKGLKAKIEAKYGSFDVFALKSISAKLEYATQSLKVEIEGGYNAEKEAGSGKASVTLGEKDKSLTGTAAIDEQGDFSLKLSSRFGDQAHGLLASGEYKDGEGRIGLGTYLRYGPLAAELFPDTVGGRPAMVYKLGYSEGPLSASLVAKDADLDQKLDEVAAELKVSKGKLLQMVFKLGYGGGELKGEAQAKLQHGGWAAEAAVSANLSQVQIDTLVAKLGFKGEDTFRQFSVEFARKVTSEGTTDSVSGLFDVAIGSFIVRGTGSASYLEGTGFTKASGGAYLAAPLFSDVKGIAGLKVDYDFLKNETSVMPGVGVQLFGAPLMFHTDFKDKFLFSIGVKF